MRGGYLVSEATRCFARMQCARGNAQRQRNTAIFHNVAAPIWHAIKCGEYATQESGDQLQKPRRRGITPGQSG